jgi:hypothetical protein
MESSLITKYNSPEPEQITIFYAGKQSIVSYREYAEILKNVYQGDNPKEYMNSRNSLLIEYMENLDKPKSQFSW